MKDEAYWVEDIHAVLRGGPHVMLRVELGDGGQAVITDLVLHASAGITSTDLRSLSLPSMESRALRQIEDRYENHRATTGDPNFADLRLKWESDEQSITLGRQFARAQGHIHTRDQLHRPTASEAGTDGFYSLVAQAYREFSQESRSPAKLMSEEANVPVTTVHRWIREARKRSLLPVGRQGRSG